MRFTHSIEFGAALTAQTTAYAAFDKLAEAGADGTPEYEAASAAEYAALDVLMAEPAQTVGDFTSKLTVFLDREMYDWDGPKEPGAAMRYRTLLERDLTALAGPNVSNGMALAFEAWAKAVCAAELADYVMIDGEEQVEPAATQAEADAFARLMALPCFTPGDFMVKAYINLLDSEGAYNGGFPFQPKRWDDRTDREGVATAAMLRDLRDSDLGRCMMALGRTDFDAGEWIDAMRLLGHRFAVHIEVNGDTEKRSFWQDVDTPEGLDKHEAERFEMLQVMLGGETWRERVRAVSAVLEAEYPAMVHRLEVPQAQEQAA